MFFKLIPTDVRLQILRLLSTEEQLQSRFIDKQFAEELKTLIMKTLIMKHKLTVNEQLMLAIINYKMGSIINHVDIPYNKANKSAFILEKIQLLIHMGADVNHLSPQFDGTPLHLLNELGGDDQLASLLIEKYKANPETVNSQNRKTYEKPIVENKKDLSFKPFLAKKEKSSPCIIS